MLLNLSHPAWWEVDDEDKPYYFIAVLLHECIHVHIHRFGTLESRWGNDGHHAAWQLVAQAVERDICAILDGASMDLNRHLSLIFEHDKYESGDMTSDELDRCFGDYFVYDPLNGTLATFKKDGLLG